MSTIASLLHAFTLPTSGRRCRTCGNTITKRDAFGLSEAVCSPCRD
jgi:hypothetical protein